MKMNRIGILACLVLANLAWGATPMAASALEDFENAGSSIENPLAIAVVGILMVVGARRKKV